MTLASGVATVNRTSASTNNPAVPIGVSANSVCDSVGLYKDPLSGALFLPANDLTVSSTGTSLGANTAVLTNPAPGSLGDHGLYKGCSGPHLNQIDMNFVKKTKLSERITFEFRAEMFNIFNHANFNPSASYNINNSGFGALTTVFTSREIQFNGRISF